MHEIVPLLRAEVEIQAAYHRYDEFGLGWEIDRQLGDIFTLLSHFPHLGSVYHGSIRRIVLKRFPYAIYYTVEGRRILIQGFLDTRQDPEAIQRRLES